MTDKIVMLEKYNFWKEGFPPAGFIRKSYLDKISKFFGNRLIKVLTGQRRVGKSYLMRQIIQKLIDGGVQRENILYINKEFTDFDFLVHYRDLEDLIQAYQDYQKPVGRIFLLIDEIQSIEGWEKLINSYSQDYTSDFEIFISGSNSRLLAGEMTSLLSGRYVEFLILPYSYEEFIELNHLEPGKSSYLTYMQSGGLPELFHLPDRETRIHYTSAIKDTILLRDIVQRYNIKDARLLEDIFSFLVMNASNLVSVRGIVDYFKSKNRRTNYETVANYLAFLETTYLIHQAQRYRIRGKEVIAGSCKYYMNDLSYKNFLYSGFDSGIGYMLENLVFLQLVNHGFQVYTGLMQHKEVDFVAIKQDRIMYLQVAYLLADPATAEREFTILEEIPDNYGKYVVTLDDIQLPNRKGIHHHLVWRLDEIL